MPTKQNKQHQADYWDVLHQALEDGAQQVVTELLQGLHPAQVADALKALPQDLRPELWCVVVLPVTKGEILLEVGR